MYVQSLTQWGFTESVMFSVLTENLNLREDYSTNMITNSLKAKIKASSLHTLRMDFTVKEEASLAQQENVHILQNLKKRKKYSAF